MSRITEPGRGSPVRARGAPAGDGTPERAPASGSGPLRRALSTLVLVSRFPVPLKGEPDFSGLPFWLPLVGFPAALLAAAGYALSSLLFASGAARSFCAILALFLAFDLFHFDGLLDSADAFMGAGSREKRLEILKDPRVGSFGLFAGIAYLGALWHCATVVAGATVVASVTLVAGATAASGAITVASATTVAILPLSALPLFLAAPVAGRAAAVLVPVFLAPARPGGLGAMIQPYSKRAAFSGIVFSLLLCFAISALAALFSKDAAAAAGSALSALFESWFRSPVGARVAFRVAATALSFAAGIAAGLLPTLATYGRKLGGYTGDALGAAVCLGTLGHMACALAIFGVL